MTYKEAIKVLRFVLDSREYPNGEKSKCYQYNLGAINKAIDALEKQIPKKPRETRCALMCASCGHKITEKGCKKLNRSYCKKCGQAIDWEVSE